MSIKETGQEIGIHEPQDLSDEAQKFERYKTNRLLLLRRAVWLRRSCESSIEPDDPVMPILNRTIYSLYTDCIDAGCRDKAKEILHPKTKTSK